MRMFYILLFIVAICACIIFWLKRTKERSIRTEKFMQQFEHYQSLDSLKVITSGNLTMQLLLESTEDIQSFLTSDNHVIIYTVSGKTENLFYKISPTGDIIDSLMINSRHTNIVFVKGFIIDKDTHQYYKWSFDGSKQPIHATVKNGQLDWKVEKQQEQLAAIVEKSMTVYVDYQVESPEPQKSTGDEIQTTQAIKTYAILNYFVNDECFQFYTTLDVNRHFPYSYTQKLLLNNLFKRINTAVSGDKEVIQTANIQYRYFQKTAQEKVRFSGGGGNAPGFNKELYHGNLFTDVVFKNDTLRLKEFMYLDEEWHASAIDINGKNIGTLTKNKAQPPVIVDAYMYYTNPKLAYALFSNSDRKLYLIKQS